MWQTGLDALFVVCSVVSGIRLLNLSNQHDFLQTEYEIEKLKKCLSVCVYVYKKTCWCSLNSCDKDTQNRDILRERDTKNFSFTDKQKKWQLLKFTLTLYLSCCIAYRRKAQLDLSATLIGSRLISFSYVLVV